MNIFSFRYLRLRRVAALVGFLCASGVGLLCMTGTPTAAATPTGDTWRTAANDPTRPGNWWHDTHMIVDKLGDYSATHPIAPDAVGGGALAAIDAVDPVAHYSRAAHRAIGVQPGDTTTPPGTPFPTPPSETPSPVPPIEMTFTPQQRATFYKGQAVTNRDPTGALVGLPTSPEPQVLGIVGHPWWLNDHLDDFVGYYKDLHTLVVRLPIEWKTIETKQGVYDFSEYDRVLNRLADEHFTVILQFSGVPVWASSDPADCAAQTSDRYCGISPAHRIDMQRLAQAIVRRYPYVRQYEFWNEPELFPLIGSNVGDYLDLLRPFYEAVKAVDPTIQVAATTLAGWDYIGWLYNVVEASYGNLRPFDAIAYHPYNFGDATDANGHIMPFLEPRVAELHTNMAAHGDGNKPIWLTEIGWQTKDATTPQVQSQRLLDSLAWIADKSYIANVDIHMLHDWQEERFGLMTTIPDAYITKQPIDKNTKFVPKQPFYDTFKYALKRYDNLSHPLPTPPDTPQARYFPETRHSVRGVFKTAWETQGGLALFGYPKTGQFWEFNPTDSTYYLAQYFERVRMEWHPEAAGTPYVVLFGLLGNQLLTERSWLDAKGQPISSLTLPATAPDPFQTNPILFAQTQQYLGGPFRAAWIAQGGLAIVGYPKTRIFQEKNPDDGQTYLVQYFERARMEWHPNLGSGGIVLFGLLGNDRLRLGGKLDPKNNQPIFTDYYNPALPEF